jgi:hypothetical protein
MGGGSSGSNPTIEAVTEFVKNHGEDTEQGVSFQDIFNVLVKSGKHTEAAIRAAATALSEDGLIYSTVDEETFKYAL